MMLIKLSSRQFAMLNQFHTHVQTLNKIKSLNQVTFGSLLHRDYIRFNKLKNYFFITQKGLDALQEFREIEIKRQIATNPLTHYFTPQANLVQMPKNKKVA